MTISQWIDENKHCHPYQEIRLIDNTTHKGIGAHWILFKDCEIRRIKITSQWIFFYI